MPTTIRTKAHKRLIAALIEARKRARWSQAKAADKLDYSQTWLARIESGQRRVDVIEYTALCKLYGSDPCKLLKLLLNNLD